MSLLPPVLLAALFLALVTLERFPRLREALCTRLRAAWDRQDRPPVPPASHPARKGLSRPVEGARSEISDEEVRCRFWGIVHAGWPRSEQGRRP